MKNSKEKIKLNYIDVTKEWLNKTNPNNYKVKDMSYFKHKGIKYKVDGKNVVLDYSNKEKEIAKWLISTFGGKIYMCPRINNPEGIKTPDYIYNGIKLDLKSIKGNGKRTIDTSIKNGQTQSENYIFDISNTKLTTKEVVKQVTKIYNTAGRNWVNYIIIKKHNKLIAVYKKRSWLCILTDWNQLH